MAGFAAGAAVRIGERFLVHPDAVRAGEELPESARIVVAGRAALPLLAARGAVGSVVIGRAPFTAARAAAFTTCATVSGCAALRDSAALACCATFTGGSPVAAFTARAGASTFGTAAALARVSCLTSLPARSPDVIVGPVAVRVAPPPPETRCFP
jgi:hypothetical protein